MILVYGFNYDEAARSFRHAAKLDPRMAPTRDLQSQTFKNPKPRELKQ